jgi:hypothetical protein
MIRILRSWDPPAARLASVIASESRRIAGLPWVNVTGRPVLGLADATSHGRGAWPFREELLQRAAPTAARPAPESPAP